MQFEKWFAVDLLKPPVTPVDLGVLLCSGDDNSVRVGVRVKSGSADTTVTGTIKGWVTLPSGVALMPFDGGKSGNSAWIDLPDTALGMAGRINIALRSVDTNESTVLLLAYATVRRVDADSYYDPDDIVSNLAETFAAAQQASEDAQQALADASNIVSYNDQSSEGHSAAAKLQARTNIGLNVQAIASPTDANDLKTQGIYAWASGTAPANIPMQFGRDAAIYGVLVVNPSGSYVFQTYFDYTGRVHGRVCNAGGTWQAWQVSDTSAGNEMGAAVSMTNFRDCNTTLLGGKYAWQTGSAPANWPSTMYGTMLVQSAGRMLTQFVIDINNNAFVRRNFNTAWSTWTQIATDGQQIAMTAGKFINLNGATADPANPGSWSGARCAVVNCSPGDVFTISATGGSTNRAYGFLDSSNNVLVAANASEALTNYVVTAPYGAAKLIVNDLNTGKISLIGASPAALVKAEAEGYKSLFKAFQRVGVIGDSLSVGYSHSASLTDLTRNLPISWPKVIGRECGVPWLNLGTSGQNVLTWCSHATYGKAQLEASGNKCQAYIIGLGENDCVTTDPDRYVPLGTTSDIGSDPDTVATTFYGGYNRIILLIKKLNPTAKIFCLTNANKSTTGRPREDYSAAVRYIATTAHSPADNVYLIDLEADYDKFFGAGSPIKNDYTAVGSNHFSPIGYEMIAEYMKRAINRTMKEHQADFANIAFVPYDTGTPTANTMTE